MTANTQLMEASQEDGAAVDLVGSQNFFRADQESTHQMSAHTRGGSHVQYRGLFACVGGDAAKADG